MGRLLEDMTRLSGEIRTLHENFRAFRKELAEGNRDRHMDVIEMCTDFAGSHSRMAKRVREQRLAFLRNLKQGVGGQLQAMKADVAAARRAWAGRGT